MAGIIVADTIQSGGSFIRLNSASQTVATINASGIYANTGNILIAANGTIGVASITNTAITGTMTQAQIGNGVVGKGPAFSVFKTTNQSISSGVWTKITYDSEEFDTNSNFASSRFTPTVAGYYHIISNTFLTTPSTSSYFQLGIYKNGSLYSIFNEIQTQNISYVSSSGSFLIYLNGTSDYIEFYGVAGYNATVYGDTIPYTYIQGNLVRAA
jgi:hypothetical protein